MGEGQFDLFIEALDRSSGARCGCEDLVQIQSVTSGVDGTAAKDVKGASS